MKRISLMMTLLVSLSAAPFLATSAIAQSFDCDYQIFGLAVGDSAELDYDFSGTLTADTESGDVVREFVTKVTHEKRQFLVTVRKMVDGIWIDASFVKNLRREGTGSTYRPIATANATFAKSQRRKDLHFASDSARVDLNCRNSAHSPH